MQHFTISSFLSFGIAAYLHTYGADMKQNDIDHPHLTFNVLENK